LDSGGALSCIGKVLKDNFLGRTIVKHKQKEILLPQNRALLFNLGLFIYSDFNCSWRYLNFAKSLLNFWICTNHNLPLISCCSKFYNIQGIKSNEKILQVRYFDDYCCNNRVYCFNTIEWLNTRVQETLNLHRIIFTL